MRYKNLTITITLGCLSLVALVGLVMLPNDYLYGCSANSSDPNSGPLWNKPSETLADFYAYHKYSEHFGMGWEINASLYVKKNEDGYGVSHASAYPTIVDPQALGLLYEDGYQYNSKSYHGNVTVKAAVFPWYYNYRDDGPQENYINTPYPSTLLIARAIKVTLKAKWLYLTSTTHGSDHSVRAEVTAGGSIKGLVNLGGTAGYEYTKSNGQVWTAEIGGDTTMDDFVAGRPTGRRADFTGNSEYGKAWASVRGFAMETCGFPCELVSLKLKSY